MVGFALSLISSTDWWLAAMFRLFNNDLNMLQLFHMRQILITRGPSSG